MTYNYQFQGKTEVADDGTNWPFFQLNRHGIWHWFQRDTSIEAELEAGLDAITAFCRWLGAGQKCSHDGLSIRTSYIAISSTKPTRPEPTATGTWCFACYEWHDLVAVILEQKAEAAE